MDKKDLLVLLETLLISNTEERDKNINKFIEYEDKIGRSNESDNFFRWLFGWYQKIGSFEIVRRKLRNWLKC